MASDPDNHDEETLKAIKDNISGLEIISGERIWSELSKILVGNFSSQLMSKMLECGFGKYSGLPENCNVEDFKRLVNETKCNNVSLRPITYLAALLKDESEVMNLHLRLKLSAFDRDLYAFCGQAQGRHCSGKPTEILSMASHQ